MSPGLTTATGPSGNGTSYVIIPCRFTEEAADADGKTEGAAPAMAV